MYMHESHKLQDKKDGWLKLIGCLECRKKLGVRVSGWRTQLKEGDGRQYVGLLECRQMLKKLVGLHTWQQLIGIWVFWTQNQRVYWGYIISLYIVHLYICWNVTLWPQNMYSQVSIKNYINSPSLSPQRSRWQAVLYSLGRVLPFSLRIGFRLQCWKDSGGLNPSWK